MSEWYEWSLHKDYDADENYAGLPFPAEPAKVASPARGTIARVASCAECGNDIRELKRRTNGALWVHTATGWERCES